VNVDAAMRGAVPGENGTLVASFLNDTTGWNASMPVRIAGAGEHIATLQACLRKRADSVQFKCGDLHAIALPCKETVRSSSCA